MNEVCKVVFGLAGGLALFLYGMNSMSDALQKAAGEKMVAEAIKNGMAAKASFDKYGIM